MEPTITGELLQDLADNVDEELVDRHDTITRFTAKYGPTLMDDELFRLYLFGYVDLDYSAERGVHVAGVTSEGLEVAKTGYEPVPTDEVEVLSAVLQARALMGRPYSVSFSKVEALITGHYDVDESAFDDAVKGLVLKGLVDVWDPPISPDPAWDLLDEVIEPTREVVVRAAEYGRLRTLMARHVAKKGYAFISYASDDAGKIDRLQKSLEGAGIPVWRDRDRLGPGERWKQALRQAIQDEQAVFIACFSKNSEKRSRSHMREELVLAAEELRLRPRDAAWFFPVKLTECAIPEIPIGAGETLSDLQYTSLVSDWRGGTRRLADAIKSALGA